LPLFSQHCETSYFKARLKIFFAASYAAIFAINTKVLRPTALRFWELLCGKSVVFEANNTTALQGTLAAV
jgi:hypothetical protein